MGQRVLHHVGLVTGGQNSESLTAKHPSGSKTLQSLVLSRLKDGKVIGVVDEDAAEEPSRQDTVEPLYPRVLLGASEGEEGHAETIRVSRSSRPAVAKPKKSAALRPHRCRAEARFGIAPAPCIERCCRGWASSCRSRASGERAVVPSDRRTAMMSKLGSATLFRRPQT